MTLDAPLPPEASSKPKTGRLALAGVVVPGAVALAGILAADTSILGLASACLCLVVGIILGVAGLALVIRKRRQLGRRRWAALLVAACCTWLAIAVAAVCAAREVLTEMQCALYGCNLGYVTVAYVKTHNDEFPPLQQWYSVYFGPEGFVQGNDVMATDPRRPKDGRIVAMNESLEGVKWSDVASPSITVLFFECGAGGPMAGGLADLPKRPRYQSGYMVCFCDGHFSFVPSEELGRLIWNPKAGRPKA
jgi:hypothetical protein